VVPISEARRVVEWRALIEQNPQAFTWDGASYTGRLTDSRGFSLDPVEGGMIANQEAVLWALRSDFTSGLPGEGDTISCRGLGWRVRKLTLTMSYGVQFDLEGPDRR